MKLNFVFLVTSALAVLQTTQGLSFYLPCMDVQCPEPQVCVFDRDFTTHCVPYNTPCGDIDCPSGYSCHEDYGYPECIPDPISLSCADFNPCGPGQFCVEGFGYPECTDVPPGCEFVDCPPGAYCDDSQGPPECILEMTCANVDCAPGFFCQDNPPNFPECIPTLTCASFDCMFGYYCSEENLFPECIDVCRDKECVYGTECKVNSENQAVCEIPEEDKLTCKTVECEFGFRCVDDTLPAKCVDVCNDVKCKPREACKPSEINVGECVDVCGDIKCKLGQECRANEDKLGDCFDVCDDVKCSNGDECRPNKNNEGVCVVTCKTARCSVGYKCVDDFGPANCVSVCDKVKCRKGKVCKPNKENVGVCVGVCDGVICPYGTKCKVGSNNKGVCQNIDACSYMKCAQHTECKVIDDKPTCVPSCNNFPCRKKEKCFINEDNKPECKPFLTCDYVLCVPGDSCVMISGEPKCIHPCGNTQCELSQECQNVNGVPKCVDKCENYRKCPAGEVCYLAHHRPHCKKPDIDLKCPCLAANCYRHLESCRVVLPCDTLSCQPDVKCVLDLPKGIDDVCKRNGYLETLLVLSPVTNSYQKLVCSGSGKTRDCPLGSVCVQGECCRGKPVMEKVCPETMNCGGDKCTGNGDECPSNQVCCGTSCGGEKYCTDPEYQPVEKPQCGEECKQGVCLAHYCDFDETCQNKTINKVPTEQCVTDKKCRDCPENFRCITRKICRKNRRCRIRTKCEKPKCKNCPKGFVCRFSDCDCKDKSCIPEPICAKPVDSCGRCPYLLECTLNHDINCITSPCHPQPECTCPKIEKYFDNPDKARKCRRWKRNGNICDDETPCKEGSLCCDSQCGFKICVRNE